MDAAYLDNLDLLDLQVYRVNLVDLEHLACLVCLVHLRLHLVSLLRHHHANHARKDHLAQPEPLAPQETLASPEPPVVLVRTLLPDHLAPKDHLDLLEIQAQMDHLETLVFLPKANHFNLETLAHLEIQAHKDHRDHLASLDETVNQDLQDRRDQKDQGDLQARMVFPDPKDHLGLLVDKESVVSARNIALWMVVFSSKMVQDVKLYELSHWF